MDHHFQGRQKYICFGLTKHLESSELEVVKGTLTTMRSKFVKSTFRSKAVDWGLGACGTVNYW